MVLLPRHKVPLVCHWYLGFPVLIHQFLVLPILLLGECHKDLHQVVLVTQHSTCLNKHPHTNIIRVFTIPFLQDR